MRFLMLIAVSSFGESLRRVLLTAPAEAVLTDYPPLPQSLPANSTNQLGNRRAGSPCLAERQAMAASGEGAEGLIAAK
jgi:hypothetical protein